MAAARCGPPALPLTWRRKGVLVDVALMRSGPWRSHAQMPTPLRRGDGGIRLYFAGRDARNRSFPGFVDADLAGTICTARPGWTGPVLEPGPPGAFDAEGIMPTAIMDLGGTLRLYYIGWAQRRDVPYQNAIGVAESRDGGRSFTRLTRGPIMGQGLHEPFFCGTAEVLRDGDEWRMWYMSTTEWREVGGQHEPLYHLRMATSSDGIDWSRDNPVAVDFASEAEGGIARATVWRSGGAWHMWYCVRDWQGYRDTPGRGYRLGHAVSADGADWHRRDDAVTFDVAPGAGDWDAAMQAYPAVLEIDGGLFLFYNGSAFGSAALGYAVATLPKTAGG